MSLIVARKDSNGIYIVSDTKLTAPDNQEFSKRQKINPKEGAIKSIIINKSSCVSFAGNVDFADNALKNILPNNTTDEIIEILEFQHKLSNFETNFIFCVSEPEYLIYEIKNGNTNIVSSSWIGSQLGFNKFQSTFLDTNNSRSTIPSISISTASTDLFSKMTQAIDSVIQDETIPEVAGFKIRVCFDGQQFKYMGYLDSYFGMPMKIEIPHGVTNFSFPITHTTAAQGGYTINFFNTDSNYDYVGLHIKQGNFGIVYKRENGGLLNPILFENIDEIDFCDEVKEKYEISPSGTTQDVISKFAPLAEDCFNKGQYEEACKWLDKGINHLYKKEKAKFYFNKAICLVHLKDFSNAIHNFNEAIKLDISHQATALQIMKKAFPSH